MIKIIFFDIDGTLLSHQNNQVPDSTKKALDRLHEKGILIYSCTGRNISEFNDMKMLHDIPFDGHVFLNGSYCIHQDKVIMEKPLPQEMIQEIFHQTDACQMACAFVSHNQLVCNGHNDLMKKVQAEIHTVLPTLMSREEILNMPVYQVVLYGEKIPFTVEGMKYTQWADSAYDGILEDGGKGIGVDAVLRYHGLIKEESMSFGDSENDIDMFHHTGISVAMGNGKECIFSQCDYITDHIDADGIEKALNHYQL